MEERNKYLQFSYILDIFMLVFFFLNLFVPDLQCTGFQIVIPQFFWQGLIFAMLLVAILRMVCLESEKRDNKLILGAGICSGFAFLLYLKNSDFYFALLAVLLIGLLGIDYHRILKVYVWEHVFVLLLAFLGTEFGLISNTCYSSGVAADGGIYRNCFGWAYVTDWASAVLFTLLFAWVAYEEMCFLWFAGFALLLRWVAVQYCQADCTTYLASALFIICFLEEIGWHLQLRISRVMQHLIHAGMVFSILVAVAAVFSISYSYTEKFWDFLAGVKGSFIYRLDLACSALERYGVSILGTQFQMIGAEGQGFLQTAECYNYVDCSYIYITLQFGMLALGLILLLVLIWGLRCCYYRNYRAVYAVLLIAVHSLIENHLMGFNYNAIVCMAFTVVQEPVYRKLSADVWIGEKKSAKDSIALLKKQFPVERFLAWAIHGIVIGSAIVILRLSLGKLRCYSEYLLDTKKTQNLWYYVAIWLLLVFMSVFGCVYCLRLLLHKLLQKKQLQEMTQNNSIKLRLAIVSFVIGLIGSCLIPTCIIWTQRERYLQAYAEDLQTISELTVGIDKAKQFQSDTVVNSSESTSRFYDSTGLSSWGKGIHISSTLVPDEVMALTPNTTLITKNKEIQALINNGFYYRELSSNVALYTNDEVVKDVLSEEGMSLSSYCNKVYEVDLADLAASNGLSTDESGYLTITADTPILSSVSQNMTYGTWESSYEIVILSSSIESGSLFYVRQPTLDWNFGEKWVSREEMVEQGFIESLYQEDGSIVEEKRLLSEVNYPFTTQYGIWRNMAGMQFNIVPQGDTVLQIRSIRYYKTE